MSKGVHLTKAQRGQVDAILEVLKPWGLRSEVVNEGPHMCLKVFGPKGGVWRITFAGTPRDPDTAIITSRKKAKQLVRDINARLGL